MASQKPVLVVRLILEQKGRSLFLIQTDKNGGKYSLVGGKVDALESPKQALIRESLEEAGVKLLEENLKLVHVQHRLKAGEKMLVLYFKADIWDGDVDSKEPQKFRRLHWHATDSIPKDLSRAAKLALKSYRKGEAFSQYSSQRRLVLKI